jgi:hypothetical protein
MRAHSLHPFPPRPPSPQPRGPSGATYSRSFATSGSPSGANVRSMLASASFTNRSVQERANAEMLGRVNPAAFTRDWELHEWRYRCARFGLGCSAAPR